MFLKKRLRAGVKSRGIKFAKERGFEYKIYNDVKSGSTLDRPAITKLFNDADKLHNKKINNKSF